MLRNATDIIYEDVTGLGNILTGREWGVTPDYSGFDEEHTILLWVYLSANSGDRKTFQLALQLLVET